MSYGTIVIDPPYKINRPSGWGKGTSASTSYMPYPLLPIDAIATMPVAELAADVSHLYCWTVSRYVADAYDLVKGWGFTPSTLLTWVKTPRGMGPGGHYASTTEFVIFARRGVEGRNPAHRENTSWWQWDRGAHSQKPDAFYEMTQRVSPGPRLDIFARKARSGWHCWGNEAPHSIPILDEWGEQVARQYQKDSGLEVPVAGQDEDAPPALPERARSGS